jgi:glycosyltransferase involved in cell wall biosynthesis
MPDHRILPGLRLTFLADQLGAGAGGGRFTTGFLQNLLADAGALEQVERLSILVTQRESIVSLGSLPDRVRVLRRPFPSRMRQTILAGAFGRTLPRSDVMHGPFYYVFPGQAARSVVTLHDLSMFEERFHPSGKRQSLMASITVSVFRANAVICDSDAILTECLRRWPGAVGKFTRVYLGTAPVSNRDPDWPSRPGMMARPYILTVGTIEPRKNYEGLLTAYEALLSELGDLAPDFVVAGRAGWMCESSILKLTALEASGRVHWFRDTTDEQLACLYEGAKVFTYLSVYEGFGYPPFEAAFAQVPMVLSKFSSVGEIWRGHAQCVDPTDIRDILTGWKWALSLDSAERAGLVAQQYDRALEFSWSRCVHSYLDSYLRLVGSKRQLS